MNPILIKPSSDTRAQIIVEGKIWGDADAWSYHRERTRELFPRVIAAYERLALQCRLVVLEGAGSPAEINLKDRDIVNLRMAAAADARWHPCWPTSIAAGAFASLVGTIALLESGRTIPDRRLRAQQVPWRRDALAARDRYDRRALGHSLFGSDPVVTGSAPRRRRFVRHDPPAPVFGSAAGPSRPLRIAVADFPSLANATDFDAPAARPEVELRWIDEPSALNGADVVILPGFLETDACRPPMAALAPASMRQSSSRAAVHAHTWHLRGNADAGEFHR